MVHERMLRSSIESLDLTRPGFPSARPRAARVLLRVDDHAQVGLGELEPREQPCALMRLDGEYVRT